MTATGRCRWAGYAFVGPFLLVYAAVLIVPLVMGLYISLNNADLFGRREWVGFANYSEALGDPVLHQAAGNTLVLALLIVPPLTALALLLALALNRAGNFAAILRGVFFSSLVLSVTIVTLIWRFVFIPGDGLLSVLFAEAGIEQINFISTKGWSLFAVGVATVWWCIGLPMMLFLAALQQVPQDLYEAAALDNASPWRVLTRITLPSIARTIMLVTIIQIVLQFQLFGQAQLMTNGGPNGSSRPLVMYIYETGFVRWDVGRAAAASQYLFLIILVAAMAQYVVSSRKTEDGA